LQPFAPRQPRFGAMRPLRHRRPQRLPPGHRQAVPPLLRRLTRLPQPTPHPTPPHWQLQPPPPPSPIPFPFLPLPLLLISLSVLSPFFPPPLLFLLFSFSS